MSTPEGFFSDVYNDARESLASTGERLTGIFGGVQETASGVIDTVNPINVGTSIGEDIRETRAGVTENIYNAFERVSSGVTQGTERFTSVIKWVAIGMIVLVGLAIIVALLWVFGFLRVLDKLSLGLGMGLGRGAVA